MDWDEEETHVVEPADGSAAVVVSPERLAALCRVVEAILSGRFDAQSLDLEVSRCDRFARLESSIQALCHQFLRITGARRRS